MRILLTLVLATVLICSSAFALQAAQGELAFVAADHHVPQIYVIGADGTGRRRLTSASGASTMPVWSPDGRKIAFVRETGKASVLSVMDADGGSQHSLTDREGHVASPAWSPNGRQLVFVDTRVGLSRIVLVQSDGTGRRDLAPSQSDQRAPAWSPDGKRVGFLANAGQGYLELYVVDADGRNLKQVPTPVPSLQPDVTDFAWLPDGRLAYTSRSGLAQEGLTLTTVSGSTHQYLGSGGSPAWSPDGRRLAFVVSHAGAPEIYVRTAAEKPVRLVDPSLTPVRPAWSPDGRQIAFLLLGGGTVSLAVADPDGRHFRRLTNDVYGDLSARPVFSWRPR